LPLVCFLSRDALSLSTDLTAMMPNALAALVLAGAVVGSVLGSWVLTKLSPSHPTVLALGVSSLFTAAQYMNLQVVEHPQWYKFLGLASFIPPYLVTSLLGSGGLSSPGVRAKSKALRFESPAKNKPPPASPRSPRSAVKSPAPTTPAKSPAVTQTPKTPKSAAKTSARTPKTDKKESKAERTPRERKSSRAK